MGLSKGVVMAAALVLAAPCSIHAQATDHSSQGYPSQTVRIVVPFSAGSVTDGFARLLADKLGEIWRQQVIVENRPGIAGTASVAKSAPDGYTLMLTSNGHTILAVVNENLPFDPANDFSGITHVASVPQILIVPPDLGPKTVADFIALARERPGQLNFASPGVASAAYLGAEVFKHAAKIELVHVPYKGSPEAVTSVMRGDTHLYYLSVNLATELHRAGKVRAIAVATPKRTAAMPNLPTVAETGLPGYKFDAWFGVMAPVNTPRPILNKVSRDIARVLQTPDISERLTKQGVDIVLSSPDSFDAVIKED